MYTEAYCLLSIVGLTGGLFGYAIATFVNQRRQARRRAMVKKLYPIE